MPTDEEFKAALDRFLVHLHRVAGRVLTDVHYWLLPHTVHNYDPSDPKLRAIEAVELHFHQVRIVITWDFASALRRDLAYHLNAECDPLSGQMIKEDGDFTRLRSTYPPWPRMIGLRLDRIQVYGMSGSPQAIALMFGGEAVLVSTGGSTGEIRIGDGDDLFVFEQDEWSELRTYNGDRLDLMFTIPSVPATPDTVAGT